MRRSSATTLQDVARDVGVATITVSVVLNGSRSGTRVSETTRARIIEAANRLHYRPNGAARGLSRRRMDNIGVVGLIESQSVNLYFLDVLTGILSSAAKHGQNTTILAVSDWEFEEDRILQFCDGRVDGIILVAPTFLTEQFAERLLRRSPYVMLHGNEAPPNTDDLDVDNEGGAYTATRYLIDLGHRRIAHFAGPMKFTGPRQRLAGYRRAIADSSIEFDESLVYHGDFLTESGVSRTRALLSQFDSPTRPSAVFCVNDVVAVACVEELTANGVKVPSDISIIGFDDGAIARMVNPQLTTIRQPLHAMGAYAVDRLIFRINESLLNESAIRATGGGQASVNDDNYLAKPHIEVFPLELIVRASTAPPFDLVGSFGDN